MSIQGTVNKTLFLLALVVFSAGTAWSSPGQWSRLLMPMVLGAFGIAVVTVFKKEWAWATSPVYAALEGIILGVLSSVFERQYPGIVIQAVSLTFGTLLGLLLAYTSRLIKATENFKLGVAAATFGIMAVYLVNLAMGFFGRPMMFLHESSPLGIGISVFVVIIAALNLVLDFDFIERGAESGAPKYMEWYGAFGLMVTLVWLYLEMLRLLSKMRDRR
jgi:uncharacterized YccA/Bax inhibitor family protein